MPGSEHLPAPQPGGTHLRQVRHRGRVGTEIPAPHVLPQWLVPLGPAATPPWHLHPTRAGSDSGGPRFLARSGRVWAWRQQAWAWTESSGCPGSPRPSTCMSGRELFDCLARVTPENAGCTDLLGEFFPFPQELRGPFGSQKEPSTPQMGSGGAGGPGTLSERH